MNSVYKERFKHNNSVYNKAAVAIVINCFKKLFYNIHVCMVTDHQTYRQRTVTFGQTLGVTWAWPFLPVGVEQEQGVGPWKAPSSDHNYFLLSKIETDLENDK